MAKTIRIEDSIPQVEVHLTNRQRLKLRRPDFGTRHEIPWAAQRPGWGNATEATNTILLRAAQGELCGVGLRELGGRDRHRLILGVVRASDSTNDWRRLYGTSLTVDERFLAAMFWASWREAREAQASLREMRERLIERVPANVGTVPPLTAGIAGIGKQLAAMNSFSRMAKTASLFPAFQSPALAGMGPALGSTLPSDMAINPALSGFAKSSVPTLGVQSLATQALSIAGVSPMASAGIRAQMSRLTREIGDFSVAKELRAGALTSDYLSSISSLAKQFELPAGFPSVAKQLGQLSGASPAIKQLEFALGRNALRASKPQRFFGVG
jgi:hypothetical protein